MELKFDPQRLFTFLDRDLATIGDNDVFFRAIFKAGLNAFDLCDHIHALKDEAKDDVAIVEPRSLDGADEELGTIGVSTRVCHAQDTGTSVTKLEVLILETIPINGLAASTIAFCEVPALNHEILDYTMKFGSFVPEALFPGSQCTEVLSGLGCSLPIQPDDYATQVFVSVLYVEVHFVGNNWTLYGLSGRQHKNADDQCYEQYITRCHFLWGTTRQKRRGR